MYLAAWRCRCYRIELLNVVSTYNDYVRTP